MVLGLIFRQSAKSKRSITSWREHAKGMLPTNRLPTKASAPSFVSSVYSTEHTDDAHAAPEHGAGFGFGRQGERAANLKGASSSCKYPYPYIDLSSSGFLISKPLESLPRYAPKFGGSPSSPSSSSSPSPRTHTPAFKSSNMAI